MDCSYMEQFLYGTLYRKTAEYSFFQEHMENLQSKSQKLLRAEIIKSIFSDQILIKIEIIKQK